MNDPIADAVRSILDGHIVLTRELATQNHYPAIDVLDSVSRFSRDLSTPDQIELAGHAREALSLYRRNQDLISIGAYPAGSNAAIDHAIRLYEPLKSFTPWRPRRIRRGRELAEVGTGHGDATGRCAASGPSK